MQISTLRTRADAQDSTIAEQSTLNVEQSAAITIFESSVTMAGCMVGDISLFGTIDTIPVSSNSISDVSGALQIKNKNNLDVINASFTNLETIAGDLIIRQNSNLTTIISSFTSLLIVGGTFDMHGSALLNLAGSFTRLQHIGVTLNCVENLLTDLGEAFTSLETIGQNLDIDECPNLRATPIFTNLKTIRGNVWLPYGGQDWTRANFPALECVGAWANSGPIVPNAKVGGC